MGLDLVEFAMGVEEAFDIGIEDQEWNTMRTLGDVLTVAKREVHPGAGGRCASLMVFHRLRRALSESGVAPPAVRPATPLESLRSLGEWRRSWKTLGQRLGLQLPRLQLSPRASKLVTAASVSEGAAIAWALGPVVGVVAGLTGAAIGGHLLRDVPPPTVGALVASVVDGNYGTLVREGAAWRDTQASRIILALASAQFGVPIDQLDESSVLTELAPYG